MAYDGYRRGYVSFAHFLLYLGNCIQSIHLGGGGISSDIRSEILFYGDGSVVP